MDMGGKMREFAGYLQKVQLQEAARAYEGFAHELELGVSRERLRQICRDVQKSLRAGPQTISDRPITNPDGFVNTALTDRFNALIGELRRLARRNGGGMRSLRPRGGSRG